MFQDPLKEQVFRALVDNNMLESQALGTGSTLGIGVKEIMDMSEPDLLKLLRALGVGPTIKKNMGGIVSLNQLTRPLGMM